MKTKGGLKIILYILLGVFVIAGLFLIWNFKNKLEMLEPSPTPNPISTPKPDFTKNWRSYSDLDLGIALKYPPNWGVNEDKSISQFRSTNIITLNKVTKQILIGYYNIDFFEKIYSLKGEDKFIQDYYRVNKEEIIKLGSGKLTGSDRYIIYKTVSETTGPKPSIKAIVFNGTKPIMLELNNYDDSGIEILTGIIQTSRLL